MKKIISLVAFLGLVASFSFVQAQQDATQNASGPVMSFETTTIDYGVIEQGSERVRVFKFSNTGTEPVVIKSARGSCGCTVPTYPQEPIMPGETADIKVNYDTNRTGKFTKTVTLETNETNPTRILTIKGEVLPKVAEPGLPKAAPSPLKNSNQ
mgnify:CR=1 FL=1